MHVEEHEVRVFDQLLHLDWETGNSGTIKHTMVSWNTKVNTVLRLPSVSVRVSQIVYVLGLSVSLTNSNDSSLRSKNSWDEVATTKVTNARYTKCTIFKISFDQTTSLSFFPHFNELFINLKNTLILNIFDIGNNKAILGSNCNAKIMALLDNKLLNVAFIIYFTINVWVNDGVLNHCKRASLDEERKHSNSIMSAFDLFA